MKQPEIIFAIEESPEGGYEAHALGHSILTQADSLPELREQVREAVKCHFEEHKTPTVIRVRFVDDEDTWIAIRVVDRACQDFSAPNDAFVAAAAQRLLLRVER